MHTTYPTHGSSPQTFHIDSYVCARLRGGYQGQPTRIIQSGSHQSQIGSCELWGCNNRQHTQPTPSHPHTQGTTPARILMPGPTPCRKTFPESGDFYRLIRAPPCMQQTYRLSSVNRARLHFDNTIHHRHLDVTCRLVTTCHVRKQFSLKCIAQLIPSSDIISHQKY